MRTSIRVRLFLRSTLFISSRWFFVTLHRTGDYWGEMPEHNLQFLFLSTLMDFSIKILSSQYQADKVISVTNILHSLRYLLTKVTSVWVWVKSEWDTQHSARRMMKRQSENLKQTKGGRGGSVRRFQILPRQTERQLHSLSVIVRPSCLTVCNYNKNI